LERSTLAPWATRSADSHRDQPEEESPVRTAFQRDRDRIIHTNSFRRLRGKTQVFISPAGDHYATRLSHVLEVSSVARVVARALSLNEDLTEAIALAHDLGHAPFGHAGQEALDALLGSGYRHDEQSVRTVRYLERGGRGLNLTDQVLDGIRTHRKPRESLLGSATGRSTTLEAEVVKISDAVAYVNHDVEDALRARVIAPSDLPSSVVSHLGAHRSERLNTIVCDIVETSLGRSAVEMSAGVLAAVDELREFLFERVYTNPEVKREAQRARHVVTALFEHYSGTPSAMPEEFQRDPRGDGVERRVADYIAGMTDAFATNLYVDLFVPKMWPA
jgi:dGTPase